MTNTWTWLCFHPANSTVRGNLGSWSPACAAVGCDGGRSKSLRHRPGAELWSARSSAARPPFRCWAAPLRPTCRPAWHPQRSASACCPGCRTPCSMDALFRGGRSFDLDQVRLSMMKQCGQNVADNWHSLYSAKAKESRKSDDFFLFFLVSIKPYFFNWAEYILDWGSPVGWVVESSKVYDFIMTLHNRWDQFH